MKGSSSRLLRNALAPAEERRAYLIERIGAELDLAGWLATRTGRAEGKKLEGLVAEVRSKIAEAGGSVEALDGAVGDAEDALAPFAKQAKELEVYCVGHAHIDMNWMWSWPETVSVTVDSVTTVLALLEEYPGFIFSQSQASVYRILERYRPDLLDRVKQFVKAGRWEVTASHWVETEKNIVNGESLCRHLLLTRAYMHELFGLDPEAVPIDWSPDTFGHAETVPTYLIQGGVKYLYLHRPGAHFDQPVPRAFTWSGPDGARVIVKNDMHLGYNGVIGPAILSSALIPTVEELGLGYAIYVYGVGDHGGGPTRRDLERIIEMASWPIFPAIRFARAVDFFERLEADAGKLPTRSGELNFEFTGCYTTQTLIKRSNRLAESSLLRAEQAVCFADLAVGLPAKGELLRGAWERTLFNHFHDILPGSGVRDTRTYAHGLFQEAAAAIATANTHAFRTIAAAVDTTTPNGSTTPAGYYSSIRFGGGVGFGAGEVGTSAYAASVDGLYPFILFSSTSRVHSSPVEALIWDPGKQWDEKSTPTRFEAIGPDGTTTVAQTLESGHYWGHRFVRICFPATVPGMGYARYFIRESDSETTNAPADGALQTGFTHVCHYAGYERGPEGLENELLRVDFDAATGAPTRLLHKGSGVIVETRGAGLEYAVEQAGGMSAWRINHLRESHAPRCVRFERKQNGPHIASIVSSYELSESKFTVAWELRRGEPLLRISIDGTWFERGGPDRGTPTLVLKVPLSPTDPVLTCEEPFGAIDRSFPNGEEVPAYRWAAVRGAYTGGGAACVLYNDTKHGHSFRDGVLRLTLIRSSYEPDPLPEIGRHETRCALGIESLAHGRELPLDRILATADAFVNPVQALHTGVHPGALPAVHGWMTIEPSGPSPLPVVSAVKLAEDGDGIILRLYNPAANEAAAILSFSKLLGSSAKGMETDLLERELGDAEPLRFDGVRAVAKVPARSIRTFRIRIDK